MDVSLRVARESDREMIRIMIGILEDQEMPVDAFTYVFNTNLARADWALFVISHQGQAIGFCSLHFKTSLHHAAEIAELEEIIIMPGFRSKGLGRMVIEQLKAVCKTRNVLQLEVSTNRKRKAAVAFYTSCGFMDSHHKLVISF